MKMLSELVLKELIIALCGSALVLFSACGDDSNSSNDSEGDLSSAEESSSSEGGKGNSSSSVETIVDVKDGPVVDADSIDVNDYEQEGAVVDKRNKKSYELRYSGIYVWVDENLDYKTTHPMSTCYDYTDSLCVKYGRLYADAGDSLCPEGFTLPRAEDYRSLLESGDTFNAQYAGTCKTQSEKPMVCSGLNDTAFYAVQGDSIVAITKKGALTAFKNDGRFASARCVKERSIVEKFKELPKCGRALEGRAVYVIEKDSAYICKNSEWSLNFKNRVCNGGETYVYAGETDILYACTDSTWHIAALEDIDKPCIDENRHKNVVFNGERYACSKTGWVKLEYPASELGECYSDIFGTVAKIESGRTFICRNTEKWTLASAKDVYGPCGFKLNGKIVTLDSIQWFCTTAYWTNTEEYSWQSDAYGIYSVHGFCTDDRLGDTVLYEDSYYKCNIANKWDKQSDGWMLSRCDSTSWDTTEFIGNKEYWCNSRAKKWQEVKHWLFDGQKDSIGCTEKNFGEMYSLDGVKYICAINAYLFDFTKASEAHLKYGACALDTTYTITDDSLYYVCENGFWRNKTQEVCGEKFGYCSSSKDRVETYNDFACVCERGIWKRRKLLDAEKNVEICTSAKDYVIFYGDQKYTCKKGNIQVDPIFASDYKDLFGSCYGQYHGLDTVYYGERFVCDTSVYVGGVWNGWYRYQEVDTQAGTHCQKDIEGKKVQTSDGVQHVCVFDSTRKKFRWEVQPTWKSMSECSAAKKGLVESNGITNSVCLGDRWAPADTFHVTDERDGKVYAAIKIGGQTWMAEPLAYEPKGRGVIIADRSNISVYKVEKGDIVYYPWTVAMDIGRQYDTTFFYATSGNETVVQGICMKGWHIPNITEVNRLLSNIESSFDNLAKCFEDDDIVGIHFENRKSFNLHHNFATGKDSIYSVSDLEGDAVWTAFEMPLQPRDAMFVTVYRSSRSQTDGRKLGAKPVRCVKDDE